MGPNNWATPQWLFDYFDKTFHFQLDVCAEPWNAKCSNYFTEEQNGLKQPWSKMNWLNPPYSGPSPISRWLKKAVEETKNGNTTVALVKNDPSTSWYSDYILQASLICILYGSRVQYEPPPGVKKSSCAFPSIIVIFSDSKDQLVTHRCLKSWKHYCETGEEIKDPQCRVKE